MHREGRRCSRRGSSGGDAPAIDGSQRRLTSSDQRQSKTSANARSRWDGPIEVGSVLLLRREVFTGKSSPERDYSGRTKTDSMSRGKRKFRLYAFIHEMDSRGRPLFDLNEPPSVEEIDEPVVVAHCVPQKSLPTLNPHTSGLLPALEECPRIVNNHAFSHAASGSGFQPFVKFRGQHSSMESAKLEEDSVSISQGSASAAPASRFDDDDKVVEVAGTKEAQPVEKEEGEWSDMEGNADADVSNGCKGQEKAIENDTDEVMLDVTNDSLIRTISNDVLLDAIKDAKGSEGILKTDILSDVQEELSGVKRKEVRGIEATHALRLANHNPSKRSKYDEKREQKLGKLGKTRPKTILVAMEDVKNNCSMKTPSHRRQSSFSATTVTRTVKDISRSSPAIERAAERLVQGVSKDQKQQSEPRSEVSSTVEISDHKSEVNGDANPVPQTRPRKINSSESSQEMHLASNLRPGSWKQSADSRQLKTLTVSSRKQTVSGLEIADVKMANKRSLPSKKQGLNNQQHHDTSVERLLREVTNEQFWHHPEESDLQCVPGSFESVEEYVRVFEPLLFEECRAQLYSTWEESIETVSRDAHIMVRVKMVERRERGWYDVIILPVHECKWNFKEGDVAILSTPRPGSARSNKKSVNSVGAEDDGEYELTGRVAGTVRRHIPTDTRDPTGAIFHFHVGDSYDSISKVDDDNLLRKFQPKSIWFLTVLGSLATTQREYIALHAFRRLNLQMQTAVLNPSPEYFPKYEDQTPSLPECFTQGFVDHLRRTFNTPQLEAIQWAAMHTAAGTASGSTKRQEPWPFTLVQGPPGTGKTHTVWGMLNVIHLVQYQHYYTSLLKKLAPESYKQLNETAYENISTGSIDEVLQSMDQNLLRTLPKFCPKPRMLVCAPSNAATDELLSRVLERGFIDGEMKVYRPDVARVGVDSQTRAAQAVSVERRTEQLLMKGREEIHGWIHQLRARESQFSQQISLLQRELSTAAAVGRSQGSVVGNANALMQSDDWAVLITDAKARNCFKDTSSIPKEFMGAKGSVYTAGKVSSNNARSFKNAGHRSRHVEMMPENKPVPPSEDEEKSPSFAPRNGSYRNLKSAEISTDEIGNSGDRPRDYGVAKRQSSALGGFRREECLDMLLAASALLFIGSMAAETRAMIATGTCPDSGTSGLKQTRNSSVWMAENFKRSKNLQAVGSIGKGGRLSRRDVSGVKMGADTGRHDDPYAKCRSVLDAKVGSGYQAYGTVNLIKLSVLIL
ncbi:putative helicase MAGATAMA 3 [Platanthera guangdongensis]|uniref:Helicase MAGATAMA 3 n=1 Tax=Platanthera guangdongensis TaxID=2320717 RepID=A0ABR2N2L9_9ASPA